MSIVTVNTPTHVVEVVQSPQVVLEVRTGIKGDKGDPGDGSVPAGGTLGQVLAKTATGPGWASFEDLTGWFENQLL